MGANSKFKKIVWTIGCFTAAVLGTVVFQINVAHAATNISATTTEHWAWSDIIGWIDFYQSGNSNIVVASNATTTGYASSSVGDISLDCATTRSGNICATSNYGVRNDGVGNLTGWGWNDEYGWISFDCNNNGGCGSSPYQVYIDSIGNFRNYAWNDAIGWISFNCHDIQGVTCSTSDYKVVTSWLPTSTTATLESSTYDTGVSSGTQLNSVLWQGNLPVGTAVKFQFAVSNVSSGPWTFSGTDGTSVTYYNPAAPDSSLKLNYSLYNNMRYFRYKAFLLSNASSSLSPRVDDIVVSWSP